jgi:hypothetical protein
MKLPLDGNTAKTVGIIAHPVKVAALATNGTLLATAGGADCTVNLYSLHTAVPRGGGKDWGLNSDHFSF